MEQPKIFTNWPGVHAECPLCKSSENSPCVLVPIRGTEVGHRVEALPVHLACILNRVEILRCGIISPPKGMMVISPENFFDLADET